MRDGWRVDPVWEDRGGWLQPVDWSAAPLTDEAQAIEAAGAPRPVGFRASTFTLTRDTWWATEELARRGYRVLNLSQLAALAGPPG